MQDDILLFMFRFCVVVSFDIYSGLWKVCSSVSGDLHNWAGDVIAAYISHVASCAVLVNLGMRILLCLISK